MTGNQLYLVHWVLDMKVVHQRLVSAPGSISATSQSGSYLIKDNWNCVLADPLLGSIAIQYLTNRAEHERIARQRTK
ncbi:hypothetical protein HPG69_015181 [Diceros bicornis minor]|uniref:Uncharacterized protein n=1 Tax=Diceros bicornis minor TaxID=77932 RepID=A0A7J7FKI4_DICBM|nr:hypothetical protein HPG69_015181 [Diceros bicornis minor]